MQQALDYLAAHHVMTLATHGPQGPWAAAVFYVNQGFDLYFLSSPRSRHAGDLALDERAAVTVQEDYIEWADIRGVQLEGRIELLSGAEAVDARMLYGTKFPLIAATDAAPAPIAAALARVHWYRLVATRAYFVDNSRGFGHREQVL